MVPPFYLHPPEGGDESGVQDVIEGVDDSKVFYAVWEVFVM